jgi:deoxyribodipyrimidine photolyase-related protein
VLGDQLDRHSSIFDSFDPTRDLLFMAEVRNESLHVPSHRQRTAVFLSAMRHFAEEQWAEGRPLRYVDLEDPENTQSLQGEISRALEIHRPEAMVAVLPGDWRVQRELESAGRVAGVPLWFLDDRHFTVTPEEYKNWLGSKKAPRMEFFYRWQRQRHGILMDGDLPVLGRWNFDAENRESVRDPRHRKAIPTRYECPPDAVTEEVLETVARNFPDNPGRLESFAWPVTPDQGRAVLHNFIEQRLPLFGRYQDAMLTDEAWMWHSHVSVALNLKLIHPTECIEAAELAWREGRAPIESVEGFVRQILGWREFIRCGRATSVHLLDGENHHALYVPVHWANLGAWLCPPYPATYGDRQFCPDCGHSSPGHQRLVSGRLRGCCRLGDSSQHAWDGHACGWGSGGKQALCGEWAVHRSDE